MKIANMQAPGWILMSIEILKRFTLEDLNLSDRDLVNKYWDIPRRFCQEYEDRKYNDLIPKALRLCINHNLRHERV